MNRLRTIYTPLKRRHLEFNSGNLLKFSVEKCAVFRNLPVQNPEFELEEDPVDALPAVPVPVKDRNHYSNTAVLRDTRPPHGKKVHSNSYF